VNKCCITWALRTKHILIALWLAIETVHVAFLYVIIAVVAFDFKFRSRRLYDVWSLLRLDLLWNFLHCPRIWYKTHWNFVWRKVVKTSEFMERWMWVFLSVMAWRTKKILWAYGTRKNTVNFCLAHTVTAFPGFLVRVNKGFFFNAALAAVVKQTIPDSSRRLLDAIGEMGHFECEKPIEDSC
jgi:hypothetical protein